jgi:hypothetical protein
MTFRIFHDFKEYLIVSEITIAVLLLVDTEREGSEMSGATGKLDDDIKLMKMVK